MTADADVFQTLHLVGSRPLTCDVTVVFEQYLGGLDGFGQIGVSFFWRSIGSLGEPGGEVGVDDSLHFWNFSDDFIESDSGTSDNLRKFTAVVQHRASVPFEQIVYLAWRYIVLPCGLNQRLLGLVFAMEAFLALVVCESEAYGMRCQAGVRIILAQQNPVFGTRGEHSVWFVNPLDYQIVD